MGCIFATQHLFSATRLSGNGGSSRGTTNVTGLRKSAAITEARTAGLPYWDARKIIMKAVHPGGFIKRSVPPDGLTVTAAAKILGAGRPALSNLLSEKASLSPEMALRLEKAFGVKMDTLLKMQTRYDAYHMRQREKEITVRRFVPA
jgi:addiction module HigA family antidote